MNANLKHAAILALCASFFCCGGSSGGVPPDDPTAPQVVETEPVDLADNALPVQMVSALFSKAMDPATITGESFTVKGEGGEAIPGDVSISSNNTAATFTPGTNFKAGRRYEARITTHARDDAGNAMAADHSWTFSATGSFFVVLSDSHVRLPGFPDDADYDNAENLANLEEAVETINANYGDALFVAVTGDLAGCLFSSDPAFYVAGNENPAEEFKSIMDGLSIPYYTALGNHDYQMDYDVAEGEGVTAITDGDVADMEAVWKKVLGRDPYYSFREGPFRFIVANSNRGKARDIVCPTLKHEAMCTGSFDEAQLAWIEGELASGDETIIFFHHPIYGDNISNGWSIVGSSFLVESNDRIYDILEENSATIRKIFFGHGHLFGSDTLHGTIGLHETGSTGDFRGNPSNMAIVSFDDAGERFETIRNR